MKLVLLFSTFIFISCDWEFLNKSVTNEPRPEVFTESLQEKKELSDQELILFKKVCEQLQENILDAESRLGVVGQFQITNALCTNPEDRTETIELRLVRHNVDMIGYEEVNTTDIKFFNDLISHNQGPMREMCFQIFQNSEVKKVNTIQIGIEYHQYSIKTPNKVNEPPYEIFYKYAADKNGISKVLYSETIKIDKIGNQKGQTVSRIRHRTCPQDSERTIETISVKKI